MTRQELKKLEGKNVIVKAYDGAKYRIRIDGRFGDWIDGVRLIGNVEAPIPMLTVKQTEVVLVEA